VKVTVSISAHAVTMTGPRANSLAMRSWILLGAMAAALLTACGEGGTGVGSTPPLPPACPAAAAEPGTPCSALQICPYAESFSAYCPGGPGAVWQIARPTDGGAFNDAPGGDLLDGGTDATDGSIDDADDASNGDATTDDADEAGDAPLESAVDAADAIGDGIVDVTDAPIDAAIDAADVVETGG
jgi:hypothetical protein